MAERTRPPLLFRLGKRIKRSGLRGGDRLCSVAGQLGMLDMTVRYELPRGIGFSVPFDRPDNRWDEQDVQDYEHNTILRISEEMRGLTAVTLFDCGADIGIISVKLCASSANITRLFAFEPNRDAFPYLERNIAGLPVEGHAYQEAVGNLNSVGSLVRPDYDESDHARYVKPGTGDTRIRTIDSLGCFGDNVILKIDVEGSELEALEGARRTIAEARHAAVLFEAHRDVTRRLGRSPLVVSQYLTGIRPFQFVLSETGRSFSENEPIPPDLWNSGVGINILGTTTS